VRTEIGEHEILVYVPNLHRAACWRDGCGCAWVVVVCFEVDTWGRGGCGASCSREGIQGGEWWVLVSMFWYFAWERVMVS